MKSKTLGLLAVGLLAGPTVANAQAVTAAASGGYQLTFNEQLRTIEFTATRDAANGSRGQGHLFNHESGTKLHFVIDCLRVSGGDAFISGKISDYIAGVSYLGLPFYLRVRDLGEGTRAPNDLSSPLTIFTTGPVSTCEEDVGFRLVPIAGGNIQVR